MRQFLWLVVLSVLSYGAVVSGNDGLELLQSVMLCSQDDPALNECLKKGIQDTLPKLKDGSRALDISPLDPIFINNTNYEFDYGIIEASIKLSFEVNGLSTATIKNVNLTFNDTGLSLEIDAFFPQILIDGNYKADIGNLCNSEGIIQIAMNKVDCTYTTSADFVIVNGDRYLHFSNYNVNPRVRTMRFYLPNLIDNPVLNHIVSKLVNKHWRIPFMITHNIARPSWEPVALGALNKLLSNVSFDELLPKNKARAFF